MLVLTAGCAALAIPALRAVTGSRPAGPWGAITGGLPAFEYWPAVVMAGIVVVTLVLGWRIPGRLTTAGLLGPLIAAVGLTAFFAVQSVRSGLPLGDSYYANKAVYSMLLAGLPLFCAVVARWAAVRLAHVTSAKRHVALALTVLVLLVAVAEVSTLTRRPGVGGGTLTSPAGVAALQARVDAVTRPPVVGDVVVAAAVVPDTDGFVTLTWIPVKRSITGYRSEYVNLFAGRTANALRHDATTDFERSNVTVDTLLRTADPAASLSEFMRVATETRFTLVVPDAATAATLQGAVDEFGSSRLRVVVAPTTG